MLQAALLSRQNVQASGATSGHSDGQPDQADAAAQRMARLSLLQQQHRERSQLTGV